MRSLKFFIPLAIFLVLVGFFWKSLYVDPTEVPSPLIGKPAPVFSLPQLESPEKILNPENLRGQVWLLNVWASWCVSCRQEHPVLVALAKTKIVPIYGLNYKDQRQDALGWLQAFGNPYIVNAYDQRGQVGIDYGVYGVPETYIIDRDGVIRHKHIGPITDDVLQEEILPIIRRLKG